jgi:hypothetical protein
MAFDGPRLRRDLVSTILQEDGVRCVDVYDPNRERVSDTSTGLGGQRGHSAARASRIEPAGGWAKR